MKLLFGCTCNSFFLLARAIIDAVATALALSFSDVDTLESVQDYFLIAQAVLDILQFVIVLVTTFDSIGSLRMH